MLIQKLYFLILLYIHPCFCKKYHNYTLYRGIPLNRQHLDFFKNMSQFYEVVFWRHPGVVRGPVEFMIDPDDKKTFLVETDGRGIYLTTIMDDVQKAFDQQTVKTYIRRRTDSFDWQNYFRIDDIYSWLFDLSQVYPEMTLKSIGKTYEGRDIMAVTIVLKGSKKKSNVIIEGGIHAREWISPAFVTYMIDQIIHAPHSEDPLLKEIALNYQWYFVPVLNPDGYEYTHTKDRMWRKNRHNGKNGVDLNRNFDIGFGTVGVSNDASSEVYCGDKAFSELESRAMSTFIRSKSKKLEYYFAFHSYGQFIIIPYANTKQHLENFDEMKKLGKDAAIKIEKRHKTQYTVGTAYDTVGYMTSGVSGCWVKKTFHVPYVATFELRDTGNFGFALPPDLILPTCKETMDGILSLLKPKTKKRVKWWKEKLNIYDGQGSTVLDRVVIIFNVILFIIVFVD